MDDTLTQGGTLAAMRGYVENRGGKVIGAMVMSAKEYSLQLAPSQEMLNNILEKHGNTMNEFWNKEFGYGIDKLTQSEAGHVYAAANVNAIRDRIAQARLAAGIKMDASTANKPAETITEEFQQAIIALQAQNPNAILKTEKSTTPCCGLIVCHTDNFVIQQVNDGSRYFQVHAKENLAYIPDIGKKLNISYSHKEPLARMREMKIKRTR